METAVIIVQNSNGDYYVHQRRADKRVFPLLYGLGAGGKVDDGETPVQAGRRELREELGIESNISHLFSFDFQHPESAYRVNVFRTVHEGPFKPCTNEFQWSGWMSSLQVDQLALETKLCPDTLIFYERFKREYSRYL